MDELSPAAVGGWVRWGFLMLCVIASDRSWLVFEPKTLGTRLPGEKDHGYRRSLCPIRWSLSSSSRARGSESPVGDEAMARQYAVGVNFVGTCRVAAAVSRLFHRALAETLPQTATARQLVDVIVADVRNICGTHERMTLGLDDFPEKTKMLKSTLFCSRGVSADSPVDLKKEAKRCNFLSRLHFFMETIVDFWHNAQMRMRICTDKKSHTFDNPNTVSTS
jgi:hypothetical protein